MGADTARAIVLGMLRRERELDTEAIARLADGSKYAPEVLSGEEHARLDAADMSRAPPYVAGDYPEWLDPHLARVFGEARAEERAALASRAPLDLRTNTLKGERATSAMLGDLSREPTRWSPWGLRVHLSADAKSPAIHAEPAFLKGLVECRTKGRSWRPPLRPRSRATGVRSLRWRRRQDPGDGGDDAEQRTDLRDGRR